MVDDDLKRLLGAETRAQQKIEKAREISQSIINKAEEETRSERSRYMQEFEDRRLLELQKVEESAKVESERIRKEGVQLASGLRTKAKGMIPKAVDEVLEMIRSE